MKLIAFSLATNFKNAVPKWSKESYQRLSPFSTMLMSVSLYCTSKGTHSNANIYLDSQVLSNQSNDASISSLFLSRMCSFGLGDVLQTPWFAHVILLVNSQVLRSRSQRPPSPPPSIGKASASYPGVTAQPKLLPWLLSVV